MRIAIATLVLCFGAACGNEQTITTPTIPPVAGPASGLNFAPTLDFDPSTVSATPSSDPTFDWEISFDATLRDVARRGIRVDEAVLTIQESGVEVFRRNARELVSGFENRVPVGGSVTWRFGAVRYRTGGGRPATGNLRVEMETGVGDFRTMNFSFEIR